MDPLSFQTRIQAFPDFEGLHYLEVSRTNVKKLGGKFLIRLVCTVNDRLKFQCGLMGAGDGSGYVCMSQARLKELGLRRGDKVQIKLALDRSKYGLKMPGELRELLRQDEEGSRRFELISAGKKRNILHFVGSAKTSDKRIDRAFKVIQNLKNLPEGEETVQGILGSSGKFNRQS
jgi:hypothetical protein